MLVMPLWWLFASGRGPGIAGPCRCMGARWLRVPPVGGARKGRGHRGGWCLRGRIRGAWCILRRAGRRFGIGRLGLSVWVLSFVFHGFNKEKYLALISQLDRKRVFKNAY